MEKLRNYDISFSGLKLGRHEFEFQMTQPFFDLFEFDQDFSSPDIGVTVALDKRNNFLELEVRLKGSVELVCDLTNERFDQQIESFNRVIVKFGEDYDLTDDEVWVIPYGEHSINIAQLVYEMSLLAIPAKRIHPDVLRGESSSEMIDLIEKFSPHEAGDSDTSEEIDPRWEALKKLKK